MRGLLAVARREIAERRMLFVAAAIAAVAPFAVPWLHGLHGFHAADVRGGTALALSLTFLLGVPAFVGGTRLPRALADRRIGFDFARPLSGWAIWGGTLVATFVLAIGSAFVAFVPAALVGDASAWKNLVESGGVPLPWPIVVLGVCLLIFGLFGAVGVALKAHSSQLLADLLMLAGMSAAALYALIRLQWAGASNPVITRALVLVALSVLFALLLAGLAAVSRGRVDIRAANRAQSMTLWGILAIGVLGIYLYGGWLLSAPPSDMTQVQLIEPSAAGPWIYVDGSARGAEAHFLYDTAGGRFTRIPWGTGSPAFSEDGRVAAWIELVPRTLRLRVAELDTPRPEPQTRTTLANDAAALILDAHGSRALVIGADGVSVVDLRTGRVLLSARIAEYTSFPRAFFLDSQRVRLYWIAKGDSVRIDIFELDIAARRLVRTGSITGLKGWPLLATDRDGQRLACNEFEAKRLRLFDARSGEYLATLTEGASFAGPARFLSDGRMVALMHGDGKERHLEVFSPDGKPLREIGIPGGLLTAKQRSTALGGEVSPGTLAFATGENGKTPAYLVSVDTGSIRSLDLKGRPVYRWAAFFGPPNAVPTPGSPTTTLFQADSGELVRIDPATGKQTLLLGKGAH
jgi:hypothetical protein